MTAVEARPEQTNEIGRDRRRKEDARLITGRTRWTDNINLPGMLHLAMVRSPFAHARITGIDTSAAEESEGVVTVLAAKDFDETLGVCINAWPITPDQKAPAHPPIASDRVAFAGEIVAVVAARSAAAARASASSGSSLSWVSMAVTPAAIPPSKSPSLKAGTIWRWMIKAARASVRIGSRP